MKKLTILLLTPLLFTSCGVNMDVEKTKTVSETVQPVSDTSANADINKKEASEALDIADTNVEPTQQAVNLDQTIESIPENYKNDPIFTHTVHDFIISELATSIKEKAVAEHNVSLCDNLTTNEQKTECKNTFFLSQALETKDLKTCDNITGKLQKNCKQVLIEVLAVEAWDSSICEGMQDTEDQKICKDRVFVELAMKENDQKKCELVQDEIEKEMCISNIEINE